VCLDSVALDRDARSMADIGSVRDGESTGLVSTVDHCVQKLDVDEYGLIICDG